MEVPIVVFVVALFMLFCEWFWPGRRWDAVSGWWTRVVALNIVQVGIVVAGAMTWAHWIPHLRAFDAEATFGVFGATVIGYLTITFVYYWWHRARHESPLLWRLLHQVHHSPSRLEVATSFYKHPLEILANGVVSGVVMFGVCGLGPASASAVTLIAGIAELFYHWNVKTPRWVGYIVQRPESHCVHHQHGHHKHNYSDLPLWDMLFGTFHNPPSDFEVRCGFTHETGTAFRAMLACVDISAPRGRIAIAPPSPRPASPRRTILVATGLAILGCLQLVGDLTGIVALKAIGAASHASPAPKVFTAHDGLETFSARFIIGWRDIHGAHHFSELTPALNKRLRGPYNRRNTFGAAIAGAPMLEASDLMRPMHRAMLRHAFCRSQSLLTEIGIKDAKGPFTIDILLDRPPATPQRWKLHHEVSCRG